MLWQWIGGHQLENAMNSSAISCLSAIIAFSKVAKRSVSIKWASPTSALDQK